jgi:hypothetical protein
VSRRHRIDPDGLLCALVLAPATFSRNRFFSVFEDALFRRVRRRAARVRGLVRELVGDGIRRGEIVGEQVLRDGRVLIRYEISGLEFAGTSALSELEASALRFALHRHGLGSLEAEDRARVEQALVKLGGLGTLDVAAEDENAKP